MNGHLEGVFYLFDAANGDYSLAVRHDFLVPNFFFSILIFLNELLLVA